ncbi:MAG: type II toxin-antitoxin system RelE/ParE family toxin [Bdellovibrionales bacterium]|nr:type II toxin-antitoxin system RelE/ParE family toxin [Bdellovibrionales bacterium]
MNGIGVKKVDYYITKNGKAPFLEWISRLDIKKQVVVDRYIQRLKQGGAKRSIRNLKDGVFEIKISYASGLRVYFAEEGQKIILLLTGGDKTTQQKDIKKAKGYWRDYHGK